LIEVEKDEKVHLLLLRLLLLLLLLLAVLLGPVLRRAPRRNFVRGVTRDPDVRPHILSDDCRRIHSSVPASEAAAAASGRFLPVPSAQIKARRARVSPHLGLRRREALLPQIDLRGGLSHDCRGVRVIDECGGRPEERFPASIFAPPARPSGASFCAPTAPRRAGP